MEKLILAAVALVAGCATHATLNVTSQPEGAYITGARSNQAFGLAPAILTFEANQLQQYKDSSGCYLVQGVTARWVSGATASLDPIKLCSTATADYFITLSRDPSIPGFEKDLQFSLQLQTLRAQQQQAQAAENAAAAALFSAWQSTQPVNCTSTAIGNQVQTNCR